MLLNTGKLERWIRPGLLLGVIAASAWLGYHVRTLPYQMIIAAAGALVLGLLALRDMRISLSLIVLGAATVQISFAGSGLNRINQAMLLVLFTSGIWIMRLLLNRQFRLVATPLNRPLVGFLVAAVVSWMFGYVANLWVILPGDILEKQIGQFSIFLLTALAFWLTANHALDERTLKLWNIFIIVFGAGVVLLRPAIGRYDLFTDWNGALFMWPFVLLVGQILFNNALEKRWKLLGLVVIAGWGFWAARYAISYKSSWVPALLAFAILLWFKSRRWFSAALLAGALAALLIGLPAIQDALFHGEYYSATPLRWGIWVDVFRMGLKSAILGLGLVTYTYYWGLQSFQSLSHEQLSTLNPYAFNRQVYAPPAHNMFADIFAQMGLVGLCFLIWTLAAGVWMAYKASKQSLSPFLQAYTQSILAGFIALIISSFVFAEWLLPYVGNLGLAGFSQSLYAWLFLGTIANLGKTPKKKESENS